MLQVARFESSGAPQWGVVQGEQLIPLANNYATTGDLLRDGQDDIAAVAGKGNGTGIPLGDVTVLSPITQNQQVVCQGANYRQHIIESGVDPESKKFNMFFRKASSCLCGANDDIERPGHVQLLDYEIELGLVLGRDIGAPETFTGAELPDAVAALVIHNDVSARDVQVPQMQFYKGKSYRTFGPTGPYLTLVDDNLRKRWGELRLQLKVNGNTRQDSLASDMLFGPAATLTEMTQLQSFHVGDLIATGTPAGVAMQLPPPWLVRLMQLVPEKKKWPMFIARQKKSGRYLNDGDLVEASIIADDGSVHLGTLSNRVHGNGA